MYTSVHLLFLLRDTSIAENLDEPNFHALVDARVLELQTDVIVGASSKSERNSFANTRFTTYEFV